MLGEELRPGLWRWTGRYPEWKGEVASVAVETEAELVLIDPLLVDGQWDRLEAGLGDRRVHVLLTIHWHARSAGEVVERFPEARIWGHSRNRAAVARRTPVTDVFKIGDELPAGLVALEARPRSEVLLWEPGSRALIVGDALLGDGEKGSGLHTCPTGWLPQSTDLEDLRSALRPALDLPIDLILPSHGAPVLSDAKAQLAQVATPAAPVPSDGEWPDRATHTTSP
jgi:glyoxylase-like metal-dependent hydrolase (beta-lactamase superfamily II)